MDYGIQVLVFRSYYLVRGSYLAPAMASSAALEANRQDWPRSKCWRSHSFLPGSGNLGKGVWERSKPEGISGFSRRHVSELKRGDVPKPDILVFEGSGNLPRFPNPSLTGLTRLA